MIQHKIIRVAHRGSPIKAPENTISSFNIALKHLVDFIEIDVRLTKDGVPVIIHDPHIHDVMVHETSEVDLMQHRIIGLYDEKNFNEKIPKLEDIFYLNWNETGLMIEIKESIFDPIIVEKIFDLIEKYPTSPKNIVVGSFSLELVKEINRLKNSLRRRIKTIGIVEDISLILPFMHLDVDIIALWYPLITKELVNALHQNNIKVWAFTVNESQAMAFLESIGIDGIISDHSTNLNLM